MCKRFLGRSIILCFASLPLTVFAPIYCQKELLPRVVAFTFFFHAKTMTVLKIGPLSQFNSRPLFSLRSIAFNLLTKFLLIVENLNFSAGWLVIQARPRTSRFLRLADSKIFCSELSSIAHLLMLRYSRATKAEESVITLSCSGEVKLPLTSSLCSKKSPSSSTA